MRKGLNKFSVEQKTSAFVKCLLTLNSDLTYILKIYNYIEFEILPNLSANVP